MYEFIYQVICKLSFLSVSEWEKTRPVFYEKNLKKGEFFLRCGETAREFGIICHGLTYLYYLDANGIEHVKAFDMEGDLTGGYTSLLTGEGAQFYVQALEDTKLYCTSWNDIKKCIDRYPSWSRLARIFAENEFIKKEKREGDFLLKTVSERYQSFLYEFPNIGKRIPQFHIASYLGIKPETLSRIVVSLYKK